MLRRSPLSLCVLAASLGAAGGASGGSAWERLVEARRGLGAPPPPRAVEAAVGGRALAALAPARRARRALEEVLREAVPLTPPREGEPPLLGDPDAAPPPAEEVKALAADLAFLALHEWRTGDPPEGFRTQLRMLRLAVELGARARTASQGALALALQTEAYVGAGRFLLDGRLGAEKVRQAGRLLRAQGRHTLRAGRAAAWLRRSVEDLAGRVGRDPTRADALHDFRAHAEAWARVLERGEARDPAAAGRVVTLVREHRDVLGHLDDVPLHRGLGDRLMALTGAQVTAEAAAWVALFRAETSRWPAPEEVRSRFPEDPATGRPVAMLVLEEGPVLVAAGAAGEVEGGRIPGDWVLAAPALDSKLRRYRMALRAFPVRALEELLVPEEFVPDHLPAVTPESCDAARRDLDTTRRRFEERQDVELQPRLPFQLAVLYANGVLDALPRCPAGGLWDFRDGRTRCSLHDPGEEAVYLREVCRADRRALAVALAREWGRRGARVQETSPRLQRDLVARGFLDAARRCPSGGTWRFDARGLVCALHGSLGRLP